MRGYKLRTKLRFVALSAMCYIVILSVIALGMYSGDINLQNPEHAEWVATRVLVVVAGLLWMIVIRRIDLEDLQLEREYALDEERNQ